MSTSRTGSKIALNKTASVAEVAGSKANLKSSLGSNAALASSSSRAGSRSNLASPPSKTSSVKNLKSSSHNLNEPPAPGQGLVGGLAGGGGPALNTVKEVSTDYYHDKELTGLFPLFLTSQSQALVKCVIETDVTTERMFRMIPKSDLIADMAARLAISDFTPAKALILAYPREEIMLHYDPEYKYTQNFFLVVDPATVDLIVSPPSEEVVDVELDALEGRSVKDRQRGWKSFGSEKEIEMERIKNMDEPTFVEISRKYGEFHAPYNFGDRDAQDGYLEIKPFKDANFDLTRMEMQTGIQAVPELVSTHAQTSWFRPVNFACQYEAIEMDSAEMDEIQHSEALEYFFLGVSSRFEEYLQLNEVMDIFKNDFLGLGDEEMAIEQGSHTILQEYQSFTDLINSKDKCISCIDWHPTQKGVLAISCTQALGFDDRINHGFTVKSKKSVIIIWSFHDPIHPQLILEAPEDVTCFQIHPQDSSIIVAGCINGQIVLWDISEFQEMLQSSRKSESKNLSNEEGEHHTASVRFSVTSSIEASHRGPVSDIHWLPKNFELANNGDILENAENGDKQLVTSSLDGTIAFWDLRNKKDWKSLDLAWRPFIRVPLTAVDSSNFDYSLSRVSLRTVFNEEAVKSIATSKLKSNNNLLNDNAPDPATTAATSKPKTNIKNWTSKFYCATEEGDIVMADWILEKTTEEKASRTEFAIGGHFGAVSDLERSPFFPEIFLSAGGWSFHIWKEKLTAGALLSGAQSNAGVTCAKWSPSRPGVFYIGRADGMLEVWDLLDKSHCAATIQSVATSAVSSINIRQYPGTSAQQFIAVGDDSGTLHIIETPRNLLRITKNEKQVIQAFFDREARRLSSGAERKKVHIKNRPAFEATQLEQIAAAAKLAQMQADEASADKPAESLADIASAAEEKIYLDLEKKQIEILFAPEVE